MRHSEIHIHLEGSVFEDAIRKINKRRSISQARYSGTNREGFFEVMNHTSKYVLTDKQDYLDAFDSLCAFLSPSHEYAEITVSPRAYDYYHEGDFEEIMSGLSQAAMQKELKVNFIIDLLRNSGSEACWKYLDFAEKCRQDMPNVVGISLAGDELKYPIKDYILHIKKAKKIGLGVTVHAGEWGTPDDIWIALESGADRIGHGIRSVDDNLLLERLSQYSVPLEICPTSNLCTGASRSLAELAILAENGVNMSINTDDPAIFNTSLEKEIAIFRSMVSSYVFKSPLLFDRKN